MPNNIKPLSAQNLKLSGKSHLQKPGTLSKQIAKKLDEAFKKHLLRALDQKKDKQLWQEIEKIQHLDLTTWEKATYKEYVKKELLPKHQDEEAYQESCKTLLERLSAEKTIGELLFLDKPLKENPVFRDEVLTRKWADLAGIAGLNKEETEFVLQNRNSLKSPQKKSWQTLKKGKKLSPEKTDRLQFTWQLANFTGENLKLTDVLQNKAIPQLPGKKLENTVDLVALSAADWEVIISQNKIDPPEGATVKAYAENLAFLIEATFPSAVYLDRLVRFNKEETHEGLQHLQLLQGKNESNKHLFKKEGLSVISWKGVSADARTRKKIRKQLGYLQTLSNRYRHLGIRELLNDEGKDPAQKQKLLERKIAYLNTFQKNNPSFDIFFADFFEEYGLSANGSNPWKGVPANERPKVRRQMMASQRVRRLVDDADTANKVQEKGYHAAQDIARRGARGFIDDVTKDGTMSESAALDIFNRVKAKVEGLSHRVANVGLISGMDDFNYTRVANNNIEGLTNELRKIDGYEELFGNINYRKCSHYRSVLGPCAYFVDLLTFIEEHVFNPENDDQNYFSGQNEQHPLHLKKRRSDLWDLPLTYESTFQFVPYIDVVNDILEQYVASVLGVKPSSVYGELKNHAETLDLPFLLPLVYLEEYLKHFDLRLADLYKLLDAPDEALAAARLELSFPEFDIVTKEDFELARTLFKIEPGADVNCIRLEEFEKYTKLSRAEVKLLLSLSYPRASQSPYFEEIEIEDEKKGKVIYEDIVGLNLTILDHINRFLRLWKCLPWNMRALDWGIGLVRSEGKDRPLDRKALTKLTEVRKIQELLGLSVEESFGLTYSIPRASFEEGKPGLFARLFESRTLEGRPYVLAGLSISDTDLAILESFTDITVPEGDKLSHTKLSVLYRYAKLANRLKLSVSDLIRVVELCFPDSSGIQNPSEILEIIAFANWLETAPISLEDLWFILRGDQSSRTVFQVREEQVDTLVNDIRGNDVLYFKLDHLKESGGLSDTESKNLMEYLVSEGKAQKDASNQSYILTGSSSIQTLENFDLSESKREKVEGFFQERNLKGVLHPYLSGLLQVNQPTLDRLFIWAGFESRENAIREVLVPNGENAPIEPMVGFIHDLERLHRLAQELQLSDTALQFITENPGLFYIVDFRQISSKGLQAIMAYSQFIEKDIIPEVRIHSLLLEYSEERSFSQQALEDLALLLERDKSLLASIADHNDFSPNPFDAIRKLEECAGICTLMGISGKALSAFQPSDNYYADLQKASEIAYGALRSKYEKAEDWNKMIQPFEDRVRQLKRDTLTSFILAIPSLNFQSTNDLYNYFLIDTEIEPCMKVSRVKAAISSLQLYVHRCLLNLEQEQEDSELTDRVHILPNAIPKDEWAWRKNYRMWEANRKVFLFPENWIEPELRDNKTPFFKELEEELLQQKVTMESATEAYKVYMTKFLEVANLEIVGSYFYVPEKISYNRGLGSIPVLYLTGRNPDGQYYFRQRINQNPNTNSFWTPWEKINIAINAKKVSPIVINGRLCLFWVEIRTQPKTSFDDGNSNFDGYTHEIGLKYTSLSINNKWEKPRSVQLVEEVRDRAKEYDLGDEKIKTVEHERRVGGYKHVGIEPVLHPLIHEDQKDKYSLFGFEWERIYPLILKTNKKDHLLFYYCGGDIDQPNEEWIKNKPYNKRSFYNRKGEDFFHEIDFLNSNLKQLEFDSQKIELKTLCLDLGYSTLNLGKKYEVEVFNNYFLKTAIAEGEYPKEDEDQFDEEKQIGYFTNSNGLNLTPVNNSSNIYILDKEQSSFLIFYVPGECYTVGGMRFCIAERLEFLRLGSSVTEQLSRVLNWGNGLDNLLKIDTQQSFIEQEIPFTSQISNTHFSHNENHINFSLYNSCGLYYRELYFHIPFLIANHLNANQQYEEAQKWYHFLFNPTAPLDDWVDEDNFPADRNWQWVEFRELEQKSLEKLTMNSSAVAAYEENPFAPHAIARERITAYQKSVVMKYIDNLLDWADQLFTQDSYESINEATLLYILAAEILGERPRELGEVKTVSEQQLTYRNIASYRKEEGNDFIINLENFTQYLHPVTQQAAGKEKNEKAGKTSPVSQLPGYNEMKKDQVAGKKAEKIPGFNGSASLSFALSFFNDVPVFCLPFNEHFRGYWDRVEDRLFKIRNCMNMEGVVRQLPLFQPPIDPGLLVKAKAAGLSLSDIAGYDPSLPAYRFAYLLEKAKSYAGTVQSFGAALQSALEKKDAEELNLLKLVHEQNIIKITRAVKEQNIKKAGEELLSVQRTQNQINHRINYYSDLIEADLNDLELTQQISKHTAAAIRGTEATYHFLSAAIHLLPEFGSPFAYKFGGKQAGDSAYAMASATGTLAAIADNIADSMGVEAKFRRRREDWGFSKTQAELELEKVENNLVAAEINLAIAEKDLEIFEKNLEQTQELHDFYKHKFSKLGLYNWLATSLAKLYRNAYQMAFQVASDVEKAYQFETDDTDSAFIKMDNWGFERAGLLAGEHLMLQLQQMEQAFLENNERRYEITQSFSIQMLNPDALIQLRETGTCQFFIPELAFDLYYPGQYKRLIKSVQLTIPCVTGPYANVGCKLELEGGLVRIEPSINEEDPLADLKEAKSRCIRVAASHAQADSGLFELNFRDERYLPFEGAGAISSWKLELPAEFRQFDYDTISDVIIHMNYTARDGEDTFKGSVNTAIRDRINDWVDELAETKVGLPRLFSLKQHFPNEWNALLHADPQATTMPLSQKHYPYFLKNEALNTKRFTMFLKGEAMLKEDITNLIIKLKDPEDSESPFDCGDQISKCLAFEGWSQQQDQYGDLWMASLNLETESGIQFDPNPATSKLLFVGEGQQLPEGLEDILILVNYTIV